MKGALAGRCQLAGRVIQGLKAPPGQAGFDMVAPYGAISAAGGLGCQPATLGRVRACVASTV
jgi:hypothetical protein